MVYFVERMHDGHWIIFHRSMDRYMTHIAVKDAVSQYGKHNVRVVRRDIKAVNYPSTGDSMK